MHMQMQKHMQDKGHVMSVSKKSKIVVHSMCYVKVPKYTTCAKFRILGPDDGRSWHAGDGEARSVCNSLSSSYFTNTSSSLSLSLSQRQRQSLSTTSLCAATTPPLHNFGLNFQCVGLVLSFLSPLALVFCWSGSKRTRTLSWSRWSKTRWLEGVMLQGPRCSRVCPCSLVSRCTRCREGWFRASHKDRDPVSSSCP